MSGDVHFFYRSGFAASDGGWRFDAGPPLLMIRQTLVRRPWYDRMGFYAHYTRYRDRPMPGGGADLALSLPYWFVALVSALCAGLCVAPRWAHRRALTRARAGLCARCGYDLRATPRRCPECGAEP